MIPELPEHEMVTEYEHDGVFCISCPSCGKKVYLVNGEPAIYDPGDPWALHHWETGGLKMSASVEA